MPSEAKFDKGDRFRRWERNLDNPSATMKVIGALMQSESQKSFKTQSFDDKKWQPRGEINVYGIIRDFATTSRTKPFARRFERTPVLIDTSRLKRSVASNSFVSLTGTHVVEIGLPEEIAKYAAVHMTGGAIESEVITKEVQNKIATWLLAQDDDQYVSIFAKILNPDMTGKRLEGEVVARPFMGFTKRSKEDITEAVQSNLFGDQSGRR